MDFLNNTENYAYFYLINNFLRDEIAYFQWSLLTRMSWWVTVTAMSALTLWILLQGYRVATGQSRESAMGLVVTSLRAALIIGVAMSMVSGGFRTANANGDGRAAGLYWQLTDGVSGAIVKTVTGSSKSPYKEIDKNLMLMQVALMSIDQINTAGNPERDKEKDRARLFMGLGMAGPGVVGGTLLLLNKLAMALFVGFGPLFILCLLFNATKSLFQKWLLYGIGTVFSLAVLTFTVTLATKVVGAVAMTFVAKGLMAKYGLDAGTTTQGLNAMALQQGGIGLVLSTLIMTAPPMAAAFFQGTLGTFSPYSTFGQAGKDPASGKPVAAAEPSREVSAPTPGVNSVNTYTTGGQSSLPQQEPGGRGNARIS